MINKIYSQIDKADIKPEWRYEGDDIESPTVEAKNKTKELCSYVYNEYNLTPRRISATIENGMFIQYANSDLSKLIEIEVYNDLDMVFSAMIKPDKELRNNLTKQFYEFKQLKSVLRWLKG